MDTSETYIKMCGKVKEIQALCPERTINPRSNDLVVYSRDYVFWDGLHKFIWLPRQAQLQEMVSHDKPISVVDDLNYFCFHMDRLGTMPHKRAMEEARKQEEYVASFTSMEQLWLAFVMKEKYQKIWNGAEWVKIEE